nr:EF-hand calcium-binding domain-containing protein 7 isoform X4 [Cavia porcellus]
MATSPGSDIAFASQKSMPSENLRTKKLPLSEEEVFYMNCRAVYLTVFKSSLENIISKDQLYLALQHAGRNPSQKTIDKYWTPQTAKLNFDDFCVILRKEKPTSKAELLKSFKQLDVNDDGYILHTDLYKFLTKRGEKMTPEEVNTIINLPNINADGKFDYIKDWPGVQSRGCFFLEDDGETVSHQYRLHMAQRSTVHLTIKPLNLSQVEGKLSPWSSVDTALYILKENEDQVDPQLVCFTDLQHREGFGWTGELTPGLYRLLPSTSGCRLRKERTPEPEEAQLVCRDDAGDLFLTQAFKAALSDVFDVIDLDGNGFLSLEEYNFFELRTSGEKCGEEAWLLCREHFDTKKNELTRQGFMDLHLMEANDREGDPCDLWVTLRAMGYNRALELKEACPFVIDLHAERCKPRLKAVRMEASRGQLEKATCQSVLLQGEARAMDGYENVLVHTRSWDFRITSVIENKSDNKVIIHINNELSKNCVNNRGLNVFAVEVAPQSSMENAPRVKRQSFLFVQVCQHVMPLNEHQEWVHHCVYSLISS